MVDALVQKTEEGRVRLRKAAASCQKALLTADVRMGKPFRLWRKLHGEYITMLEVSQ